MVEILTGEFFWGIIIGLFLSVVGGLTLAQFSIYLTEKKQTERIYRFCSDTITTIREIVGEMDGIRDRTKTIHHDFLELINVEIAIFGRNREHLILLPEEIRKEIRKFITDCALRRAEILWRLQEFQRHYILVDEFTKAGDTFQAGQHQQLCDSHLADAHRSVDKLARIINGAPEILNKLST
jgi:hypothetical protein